MSHVEIIPLPDAGHLLFAAVTTGYILIALQLEERDLAAELGDQYRDDRSRVPMLIPWPRLYGQATLPSAEHHPA